tara:strand:- start:253 stop:735 length:483 start_codon:yes stop_codon:yes gene_type:complete
MRVYYAQIMREALEKYGIINSRELAEKPEFKDWPFTRIRQTRNNVVNSGRISRWTNKNPKKRMMVQVKSRCKRRNIFFDLVPEDIEIPTHCPVLGIPLDKRDSDHLPSLDRFDNSKGYTKDNINVISYRANHLKNDATFDEIEKLYDWMKAQTELRSRHQ